MKRFTNFLFFIFLAGYIVTFSSCKKDEEENKNPSISSVTVTPAQAETNSSVTVAVVATDPDGDALTYVYTVSGGAIQGNGATATWTAPQQAGTYSVTVTVNDGKGGNASSNGTLTVIAPPTQITGTASFPAGTSGDLSNAKVSIYTSLEAWNNNSPIKFVTAEGSGANITFTITDINPGNYYLDVWKDNDNSGDWSDGDFLGWYGSGGLGSPSLTQIQISEGETVTVNVSMFIVDNPAPATGITGTATIAQGDLSGSNVYLYTSFNNWQNFVYEYTVTVTGAGETVNFQFEDINPGTYYLDVWKDNDNDNNWSPGDYIGWYGELDNNNNIVLWELTVTEGNVEDVQITMYELTGKGMLLSRNANMSNKL